MKQLRKSISILFTHFVVVLFLTATTSCEREWPDEYCDCNHGGNVIGGWEDANDTTIVNKNDTVGGFSISVDEWGNAITRDIQL